MPLIESVVVVTGNPFSESETNVPAETFWGNMPFRFTALGSCVTVKSNAY